MFLGIDFGGGSAKATLLSMKGDILAASSAEYPTLTPAPGACEQKSEDWIEALCRTVKGVLEQSGAGPHQIACVALSSATHSSLLCDKDFCPVRPAMHWTDSRSFAEAEEMDRTHGREIFEKTFHRPGPIWTLPQLNWLKKNEPDAFRRGQFLFFEKDYIRYFLTGEYATDFIEAEGSMLFDCRKMKWDKDLVALAGLREENLPPVVSPLDPAGKVTKEAAGRTGLCEGTPVICGSTDTVMEIFASGAVEPGDCTIKLATAGRICIITDHPVPDRHLVNYSHIVPGLWYPGTATKSAAASYRWFRDTFGEEYRKLDEEAASTPPGADGLFFHPYLNGELTPYADPFLSASFTGVRAHHTKGHFARAVMEGVAYSMLEGLLYWENRNVPRKDTLTLIGGGAKGEIWRRILANVLGVRLRTASSGDSSLGSAMLAGIAAGAFSGPEDAVKRCVSFGGIIEPDEKEHEAYLERFETYRAIHDALAPVYQGRKK